MLIGQVLKTKGVLVFTITPDETVGSAARQLHERKVGALIVMGPSDTIVGIVSERDIVREIAREGAAGLDRPIGDSMTREVVFADPGERVDVLLERMTDRRIRHLPVSKDGKLLGIVSIGDLVKVKIAEIEAEADGLKSYIAAG